MNKNVWVGLAVIVLVIIVGYFALYQKPQQDSGETIKVGVIAPMTGDAAAYGEQLKQGLDIAESQIEKDGGTKIEVVYADNQFDPKQGLSAYQKLVTVDHIQYLITFGGNVCPIINPRAQEDHVVNFATGCNTLAFTDPGSYNFRFDVSEAEASKALIAYAKEKLNTKTVALLYVNNDWGTIVAQTVKDAVSGAGISVIADEKYDESSHDVRTQLSRIKAAKPDAVFFLSLVNFTPALLQQVHEQRITSKLLTNISIQGVSAKDLGSVASGVYYSAPKLEQVDNARVEGFRKVFSETGSGNFASWGFDSLHLFEDAFNAGNKTPEAVSNYLHNITDYGGAFGKITYNKSGELKLGYQIKEVLEGKFIEVK